MSEASNTLDTIIKAVINSDAIGRLSSNHEETVFDTALTMVQAELNNAQLTSEDLQECLDNLDETLRDAFTEEDYYQCELTGATLHIDDTMTISYRQGRDSAIVSAGFDHYECSDCNQQFLERGAVNSSQRSYATTSYETNDNGTVCEQCYEDHYQGCSDCGESYHIDNVRYHEGNEESYCEGCFPTGLDTLHNRLVLPRAASCSADGLAVGWEIEFYPSDNATPPSSHHVERIYHDGSLTSEGREITTQPALPSQWKERLSALEDVLSDGVIEADCGGHLHVDARYLHSLLWNNQVNVEELQTELNQLDRAARALRSLPSYHAGTQWTTEVRAMENAINLVSNKINNAKERPNYLKRIHTANVYYQNALRLLCNRKRNESTYARPQTAIEPNFDKYMAFNISGLHQRSERKTVEFRLWDGCIDTEDLYRRAEVCESIVRKLTEVAEWLKSDDDLSQQKARQFLDNKTANNLQTDIGFWDLFSDGQGAFDEIKTMAGELGLSEEWLNWAKAQIIARAPEKALAA